MVSHSNPCEDLKSHYNEKRKLLWQILNEPEKFGLKEASFFNGEVEKITGPIENELYAIGNECLSLKFKKCYPELKETISFKDLSITYDGLKDDHSYRMKNPHVFCYKRAKKLGFFFAAQGYKTEILHIKSSPVLIAPLLDPKDNYLKKFIDYHGSHYVLSIKTDDGKAYILDPQFSETPLIARDYFIKTTGYECQSSSTKNIWGCNFETFPLTREKPYGEEFRPQINQDSYSQMGDSIEDVIMGNKIAKCGYVQPSEDYFSPLNKPDVSKEHTKITDELRGEIIVASLQRLYLTRTEYLDDYLFEHSLKNEFNDYKKQVKEFKQHIKKVCKNFEFTKDKCNTIRKNYSEYLKGEV